MNNRRVMSGWIPVALLGAVVLCALSAPTHVSRWSALQRVSVFSANTAPRTFEQDDASGPQASFDQLAEDDYSAGLTARRVRPLQVASRPLVMHTQQTPSSISTAVATIARESSRE